MGLSADQLKTSLDALAAVEPAIAAALARAGYPEPRLRDPGYETLLRTIVGQQVSVAAAQSIWSKIERLVGDLTDPRTITAASDETLRAAGFHARRRAMRAAWPRK